MSLMNELMLDRERINGWPVLNVLFTVLTLFIGFNFHSGLSCSSSLQSQTLPWLTSPKAKSIMRPRSAGGCLMTTSQQINTFLSTAGGCKHNKGWTGLLFSWTDRNMCDLTMWLLMFSLSRLRGPSQPTSQEDGEVSSVWRATERVYGPSAVVSDMDPDSLYSFRVKSCRNSLFSPYSPEVTFHTPPAPGRSERWTDLEMLFHMLGLSFPWRMVGRLCVLGLSSEPFFGCDQRKEKEETLSCPMIALVPQSHKHQL